jgi:lysozyme family protein
MANIDLLVPKILHWEGGFVNNPFDKGGATNMGVTLAAWQHLGHPTATEEDIKNLTQDDFKIVLRQYWNQWQSDRINNQSIAEILVDWVWGSGIWGIKIPQQILGVVADGQVGNKTIDALNLANQSDFYNKIVEARKSFLNQIVEHNPTQKIFLQGWMNRLNDYQFDETTIV